MLYQSNGKAVERAQEIACRDGKPVLFLWNDYDFQDGKGYVLSRDYVFAETCDVVAEVNEYGEI